jgi:hypothetical protein
MAFSSFCHLNLSAFSRCSLSQSLTVFLSMSLLCVPLLRNRNNVALLSWRAIASMPALPAIRKYRTLQRTSLVGGNSHGADQAFNRGRETTGAEHLYMFCQQNMQGVFCGNTLGTTIPERGHIDAGE